MSQTYFAILTAIGEAKLANATALGTTLQLTQMGVGDGNGSTPLPNRNQTTLLRENRRAPLNRLFVDPTNASQIIAEQVIPEEIGGWWIREIGLFDTDGNLCAVANCPDTYKPVLAEGSGRTQVIRMVLIVSNTSAVQLKIDPAIVLATRGYVDEKISSEIRKLDWKQSVRVATKGPVELSGLQTVDGVLVSSGDRVLVKDQALARENGIYVAGASAWARSIDADLDFKVTPGLFVFVEEGSAYADSLWQLISDGPILIGGSDLVFSMAAGKTGVESGVYDEVIVNAYGKIIGGSNPATPPRFDYSTKKATTEYVKQAGIQSSGFTVFTASAVIPADACGSMIQAGQGSGNYTLTLPPVSSCPAGSRIEMVSTSTYAVSVISQEGDSIGLGSLILNQNDTLQLQSNGQSTWFVVGGTVLANLTQPGFKTKGQQRFTVNGLFIVPLGVTQIYVSGCGGGGGGGGTGGGNSTGSWVTSGGGGGGGAAQFVIRQPFPVVPAQTLTITIGGAGSGGASGGVAGNGQPGTAGGNTTLVGTGVSLILAGGGGGQPSLGVTGSNIASIPGAGGNSSAMPGAYSLAIGNYGYDFPGIGGMGGGTPYGTGGGAGAPASGFGSGGGGASGMLTGSTAFGNAGASGAPGLLIVEW